MTGPKTYWHLLHQKRMPTDYELLSSRLLYYIGRGFEVNMPLRSWYRQYQEGSPLQCSNWDNFCDPRATTYTKYTELQTVKEHFVDGVFQLIEDTGHDRRLSSSWVSIMDRLIAPLRFPVHGLQMAAAYVGQMAPSGRLVIAALFQAGDEMRRVQRLAYRLRQLQLTYPHFGQDSRAAWQSDPVWQPLRKVLEKLLICYDWGEAFVALNLVLKPLVDEWFMSRLAVLGEAAGDHLLRQIFYSLNDDCRWHRQWSEALVRMVLADRPANRAVLEQWVSRWYPGCAEAVRAFFPIVETLSPPEEGRKAWADLHGFYQEFLGRMGLSIK